MLAGPEAILATGMYSGCESHGRGAAIRQEFQAEDGVYVGIIRGGLFQPLGLDA